jgi:hypothetical protein
MRWEDGDLEGGGRDLFHVTIPEFPIDRGSQKSIAGSQVDIRTGYKSRALILHCLLRTFRYSFTIELIMFKDGEKKS